MRRGQFRRGQVRRGETGEERGDRGGEGRQVGRGETGEERRTVEERGDR